MNVTAEIKKEVEQMKKTMNEEVEQAKNLLDCVIAPTQTKV